MLLCCLGVGAAIHCTRTQRDGVTLQDMHGAQGAGASGGGVTLIANVLYKSADPVDVKRTPNVLYQGGEAAPPTYAVSANKPRAKAAPPPPRRARACARVCARMRL